MLTLFGASVGRVDVGTRMRDDSDSNASCVFFARHLFRWSSQYLGLWPDLTLPLISCSLSGFGDSRWCNEAFNTQMPMVRPYEKQC
jgi:hypothetical protein